MAADLGRRPGGPSARDACPAGERVAGFGEAALAAACATGVCTGGEAESAHERSRLLATGQLTECSHAGDGHRAREAAPRLEGLHDGGQAPSVALRTACGLETREPFLLCRHGADGRLADHWLGGRRTDDCRPPAPRGRPPRGTALIPEILAPQAGLHPVLGGLAIPDGLRPRAGAVADGLVRDRGDLDWRQSAGTHQPGALGGVASIGFDAVPRLLRDPCRGHDPAAQVLLREVAGEPGPTGTGFVDEDELWAFDVSGRTRVSRSHWRVPMGPRKTTSAALSSGAYATALDS